MRIRLSRGLRGFDMTPMIDIAFLLIAFFMVLINFSEADQNQRIKLPRSELAQPPEVQPHEPLVLQVLETGQVIYNSQEYDLASFAAFLTQEKRFYTAMKIDLSQITVIIRGDARCETGTIQEIMKLCQQVGFSDFKLRVSQMSDAENTNH